MKVEIPYCPTNEQGVVFLFGQYAKELGYEVKVLRREYPDCIAVKDGKDVRIEFEFESSNFRIHDHDPAKADLVVCWRHNAQDLGLPVLELSGLIKPKYGEVEKEEPEKPVMLDKEGRPYDYNASLTAMAAWMNQVEAVVSSAENICAWQDGKRPFSATELAGFIEELRKLVVLKRKADGLSYDREGRIRREI